MRFSFINSNLQMDDEKRIEAFQFTQMTSQMLCGATLSSGKPFASMTPNPNKKRVKPIRPSNQTKTKGLRTFDDIVQSGAYVPNEYHPKPIKTRPDDEKDRLANLMAYGVDPNQLPTKPVENPPTIRQIDRFDELLMEIEERREFLQQMKTLGKTREYQQMINQEIAEKIREMEMIDRQRSKALDEYVNEQKNLKK